VSFSDLRKKFDSVLYIELFVSAMSQITLAQPQFEWMSFKTFSLLHSLRFHIFFTFLCFFKASCFKAVKCLCSVSSYVGAINSMGAVCTASLTPYLTRLIMIFSLVEPI
jgi:hypothetical protein